MDEKPKELLKSIERSLSLGIEWIERKQEEDGSWSYDADFRSKVISLFLQHRLPSTKTVDTTSSCARHIYIYRKQVTPEIKKALNFLRGRQDVEDGSFENDWLKKKCPMATAIVGKNIAMIVPYEKIVRDARSYVKRTQKNGYWETPGEYKMQNLFMATCICAQFLKFYNEKESVKKAIEYLCKKQHPDGYWVFGNQEKRIVQELTMQGLDTLVECGFKDSENAKKAASYLLNNPYEELDRFPFTYLKWNNTLLKFSAGKTDLLNMSYSNILKILERQKSDGSFSLYHTGLGYHVVGELLDLYRLLS